MPRTSRYRRIALLSVLAGLTGIAGCKKEEKPSPNEVVFADFAKRMDAYLVLRKRALMTVGDLDRTKSQADIATRATALGKELLTLRKDAKEGDMFTPDIAAFLATLIKEEHARRSDPVQETRADQQDEVPDFVPKVNELYPTTYPLATFPPKLLTLLPPLPDVTEYRIVGNYLLIRDIEANLVLDVMQGADPAGGKSS